MSGFANRTLLNATLLAVLGLPLVAIRSAALEEPAIDFVKDVKPILDAHCVSCHGPTKQNSSISCKTIPGHGIATRPWCVTRQRSRMA